MKKKVYLSGRMSGLSKLEWRTRFSAAKYRIRERYNCDVLNPAETPISRWPWLYRLLGYRLTLWIDLQLLRRCTHIYMVGQDWRLSRGARLERMKALHWGIILLEVPVTDFNRKPNRYNL